MGAAEPLHGGFREHFKLALPLSGLGKRPLPGGGGLFPLSARAQVYGQEKLASYAPASSPFCPRT